MRSAAVRSIKDNLRLARGVRHDNADPQRLLVERRCFEQGDTTGHATLRVRHEAVLPTRSSRRRTMRAWTWEGAH